MTARFCHPSEQVVEQRLQSPSFQRGAGGQTTRLADDPLSRDAVCIRSRLVVGGHADGLALGVRVATGLSALGPGAEAPASAELLVAALDVKEAGVVAAGVVPALPSVSVVAPEVASLMAAVTAGRAS